MSASESAPATSDLHKSFEHLIAETVKQSRVSSDAEKRQLTAAMQLALDEIETSQQALTRAAESLRTALGTAPATAEVTTEVIAEPTIKEELSKEVDETPAPDPAPSRGEHELDVIAHHASIGNASGLQAMLRARSEVKSAQTREFVHGELRLQVCLRDGLDMGAFTTWLEKHNGTLVTSTDSVIEIRFAS